MTNNLKHHEGEASKCVYLGFPNWTVEFHVQVDSSSISIGAILAQPIEGKLDHII